MKPQELPTPDRIRVGRMSTAQGYPASFRRQGRRLFYVFQAPDREIVVEVQEGEGPWLQKS